MPIPDQPDAFAMLAPGLQRALWDNGWKDLREIQRDAILAWNDAPDGAANPRQTGAPPAVEPRPAPDLLIMAETAGGKTEAAFLPVLSHIADEPEGSVRAVYVGPLKALINDQFERVELLCRHMDMPVHRWHGDVGDSAKEGLTAAPSGVLLITPESLESLLINRTARLSALFGGLRAVVIDELHAFLENERGRHLASLLARVARHVEGGARPRRLGLSATIGDPMAAAAYLCPEAPDSVRMIRSAAEGKQLLLGVHWYGRAGEQTGGDAGTDGPDADAGPGPDETDSDGVVRAIAADLVRHMHGSTNLVFANAKGSIEMLADAANRSCRAQSLDERFHVHHGSLSKAIREDVEAEMKDPPPDTAICSSTLEMGIDIGKVRTVGQVGAPWSVASLKQRLGRSGRRDGEPRRLRIYLADESRPGCPDPEQRLPLDLLQTVAALELMLTQRWVEPPRPARLDLSTLTQQVISSIAETGGLGARELHQRLCGPGPFQAVSAGLFARMLRSLGAQDIVEQVASGELILGLKGEEIRSSREFYATFHTPREYAVRAGDAVLGSLPITVMPREGDHLVFAGRRWQVRAVDVRRLEVMVSPARGGKRPLFSGSAGQVHPWIREMMLNVLAQPPAATYLDPGARERLRDCAAMAQRENLARRRIVETSGSACALLTWSGTRIQETLVAMLAARGLGATAGEISVVCKAAAQHVREALESTVSATPDPRELARHVHPKAVRKYDEWLEEEVLEEAIAADRLEVVAAVGIARDVLQG